VRTRRVALRTPSPTGATQRRSRLSPGRTNWKDQTAATTTKPKIAGTTVIANDPPPGMIPK